MGRGNRGDGNTASGAGSPASRSNVLHAYLMGETVDEIAGNYSLPSSDVSREIEEALGGFSSQVAETLEAQRAVNVKKRIADLHQSGQTEREIARSLEGSSVDVAATIREIVAGQSPEETIIHQIAREDRVSEFYLEGQTHYEIARALGVTQDQVAADISSKMRVLSSEQIERDEDSHRTARESRVAELYREGRTHSEIARALGVTQEQVAADIASKMRGLSPEQIERDEDSHRIIRENRAVDMYREGRTHSEIAQELGLPHDRVYADIATGHRYLAPSLIEREEEAHEEARSNRIFGMYLEGTTSSEIAEKLGTPRSQVDGDIARSMRGLDPEKIAKRESEHLDALGHRIRALHKSGQEPEEIAEKIGISEKSVQELLES